MSEPADLMDLVASDGKPMGETELHVDQIVHLVVALRELARRQALPDAHVGSNLNFYYDPARRRKNVCPDVFWVRGLVEPRRRRRVYALWAEGKGPDLVIEVCSQSTWEEDLGEKKALYRDVLKVAEYVVFDPEGGVLPRGPLLGWRLAGRAYRPIPCRKGALESRVLGGSLVIVDGILRVADADGAMIPGDAVESVAQGVAQGRAEGLERLRRLVRQGLDARIRPVPADVSRRLAAADEAALERASLALLTARDDAAAVRTVRTALGLV